MKLGFLIDNRKCIGCHACTLACKSEHDVPIGVNRTWVKYIEKGVFPHSRRIFTVMRCNHCDEAPCVEICPVGALFNRDDGIVDFNMNRCIGCKSCTQACPYNAIYIDPNTNTAAKCNYCAHKVDAGMKPACVIVCPEEAIVSGDLDNPESEIRKLLSRQQVQTRKPEKGTVPKLYYINGDAAALNPMAAPPTNEYVQTEQIAGVGHYARYAEKRLNAANQEEMKAALSGTSSSNGIAASNTKKTKAKYESEDRKSFGMRLHDIRTELGKLSSKDSSKNSSANGPGLLNENARRTHDIPDKGVLWGWELPAYLWSKAVSAGIFFLTAGASLLDIVAIPDGVRQIGALLSLAFMGLTAFFLVKDLDRPDRFLYVLLRPQWKSWLTRGGVILNIFGGSVTAWLLFDFLNWNLPAQIAAWTGLISSIALAVYTAFLLAQAKGRDFWQSPVLPFHMAVHGLMAGAAALLILAVILGLIDGTTSAVLPGAFLNTAGAFSDSQAWFGFLQTVLAGSIVFNLMIVAAELLLPHPTADAKLVVIMITKTRFASLFYAGVLLVGNILPLLLLYAGGTDMLTSIAGNGVLFLSITAAACTQLGIMFAEHIWIRAPQLVPLS